MILDLFASVCQDCGVDLVGGPGLCVPCARAANDGACPACDDSGDCPHCPHRLDGCMECDWSGDCSTCGEGWGYEEGEGPAPEPREVAVADGSPLQGLLAGRNTKGER